MRLKNNKGAYVRLKVCRSFWFVRFSYLHFFVVFSFCSELNFCPMSIFWYCSYCKWLCFFIFFKRVLRFSTAAVELIAD